MVVTCSGHLLQQSLYDLSQFLWFGRLEGACLGSSGLGSFVFLIRQWLGAGMAPLCEVPWPPTRILHTAGWGFLTTWWPRGSKSAYLRVAAPGERAGAHMLRYLMQLYLFAPAALTKYRRLGADKAALCFLPVLKVSVSLAYWPSSPCVFTWYSLCTCQCPNLLCL